jgi:hypothetical protein
MVLVHIFNKYVKFHEYYLRLFVILPCRIYYEHQRLAREKARSTRMEGYCTGDQGRYWTVAPG